MSVKQAFEVFEDELAAAVAKLGAEIAIEPPSPVVVMPVRPRIEVPGLYVGVTMRRIAGSWPGYKAYQGRWRVVGGPEIGGQANQVATVPVGASVEFREWYQKAGAPDEWLDSAPVGPFTEVPTAEVGGQMFENRMFPPSFFPDRYFP